MIGSNRFCHFGGWSGRETPAKRRPTSTWTARPAGEADLEEWGELFAGYCDFYERPLTEERRRQVGSWIGSGTIRCLLAVPTASAREGAATQGAAAGGRAVGLAHVRPCPSPLRGEMTGYLDDLFVAPEARGTGAFEALLEAIGELAAEEGWAVVRWITAADNTRAQRAYDRISTRTEWVTYQLDA